MTTARTLLFSTAVALLTAVSAPAFAVDNAPATARYHQVTDSYSLSSR
ncbi:hypothetical protein ACOJBO_12970 [Rhizobium beringeri]